MDMLPEGWKPEDFANFDEDLISDSEWEELIKDDYIPKTQAVTISDEALSAISRTREPNQIAKQVTEYALSFLDTAPQNTAFHKLGGRQFDNPLEKEAPYLLDDSAFIYWIYNHVGVELGSPTTISRQQIMNDLNLKTVGTVGSNLTWENLTVGDILLFNHDRLMGLYVGEGQFLSWMGNGFNNYSGGLRRQDMTRGKWFRLFQGHILRLED